MTVTKFSEIKRDININRDASSARKALVFITPELASEWLSKSVGNRPLMVRQVDKLVREIKAGRWNPETSEIRLNVDDKLIDGHHRLTAIKKSGIGVWQWVAFGCRTDTIMTIDSGVSRTNSGMRVMLKVPNAKIRTALANAAGALLCTEQNALSLSEQDELLALVGEELVERAIAWNRAASESQLASPAHVAGMLMVLARTWLDAIPFCARVVTANGEAGEPSRELARWLMKIRGIGSGGNIRVEISERTANAWTAHRLGEQRSFIRGKRKNKNDGAKQSNRTLEAMLKAARTGWARSFVETIKPSLLASERIVSADAFADGGGASTRE